MQWNYFLVLLSFFAYSLSAPVPRSDEEVLKPSEDPFYTPPDGFEKTAPGTILRQRVAPYQMRSVVLPLQVKNVWQFLVRTNDVNGDPIASAAMVIEPYNSDPKKLVSFQVAEDAPDPDCAPSFTLTTAAPIVPTLVTQVEMWFMQDLLNEGYFVVSPDYEGTKGAFTIGRLAGKGVLDSITAALSSGNTTGIDKDAKTVLFGYSGGSLASGWAAALQPEYAPHLNKTLLGAALGGFVSNISAVTERVDGGFFSGLSSSGLNGVLHAYPDFQELLNEELNIPANAEAFKWAESKCLVPNIVKFLGKRFFTGEDRMFKDGFGIFQTDIAKKIVDANTLAIDHTKEIPNIPLYVFHSENDEVAPFRETQRVFDNWCDWGIQSFELQADIMSEHITEYISGAPGAINWIKGLFEGNSTVQGCKKTTRFTNLEIPNSFSRLGQIFTLAGDSFMQEPIGAVGAKTKLVVEETKNS